MKIKYFIYYLFLVLLWLEFYKIGYINLIQGKLKNKNIMKMQLIYWERIEMVFFIEE